MCRNLGGIARPQGLEQRLERGGGGRGLVEHLVGLAGRHTGADGLHEHDRHTRKRLKRLAQAVSRTIAISERPVQEKGNIGANGASDGIDTLIPRVDAPCMAEAHERRRGI